MTLVKYNAPCKILSSTNHGKLLTVFEPFDSYNKDSYETVHSVSRKIFILSLIKRFFLKHGKESLMLTL